MWFKRSGASTSPWKPNKMTAAQITAAVAVVAALVIVPIPVAAWAAAAIICSLWPNPDKPETLQRQMTEAQSLRARKAITLGKQLRSPTSATVGFGDPGNDPYNPVPVPWPPTRLSAWWSLYGAAVAAVAAWYLPIPWFCPPPARAVLTGLGAFLLFQSFAAGVRAGKDNIETAPAALWDTSAVTHVIREHIGGIVAAAAIGAVGGVLFFGPTITWSTKSVADTVDTVEGFISPTTTTTTSSATTNPFTVPTGPVTTTTTVAADQPVEPVQDNEGTRLPATLIAALTALTALTAAAAVVTRLYIEDQLEEWNDYITKRDEWQQRWETMNLAPPIYVTTVPLPHGADEPTHELVAFTTHSGFTWEDYAKYHEGVQTSLGKPFVLFRPMPQRDETGRNIPGTANPGEFTITYPTTLFSPNAHLDPETDHQTRRFLTEHRFQHAFAAAKAGTPIFIAQRPLHRQRSQGVLYETIWKLPKEIDVATLAAKHLLLAQNLGCKWLRVGTHATDQHGRQLPTQEITIVYGDNPDTVDLRDPTLQHWLQTLTWDAWWRDCKTTNNDNHAPRLTHTHQNDRGFTEADFALPPGIDIETCRKSIPALCATSGYGYIEIEPEETGNPSLIHLVAGLKDPLNEQYLFVDYADQILHEPAPGQPQLDWAVGVGADGELMWYSFDAELPHLLLAGSSGQGKALAVDTPIPTAAGLKRMDAVQVGDIVFDERGEPCHVVAATEVLTNRSCYEVEFDDGTVIVADADHQWCTETEATRTSRSRHGHPERTTQPGQQTENVDCIQDYQRVTGGIVTTEQIAATLHPAEDGQTSNHAVRVAPPAQFPGLTNDMPVEPYVLGVWLTSGGARPGTVTAADPQIMQEVALAGYTVTVTRHAKTGDSDEYEVLGLETELRELGLLRNKHIPDPYLYASEKHRWALLQGLMDNGGSVDETNRLAEFNNTNPVLVRQVHQLTASLGIKTKFRTGPVMLDGRVVEDRYQVAFMTTEMPFRLDQNGGHLPTGTRHTRNLRYIVDVRPVASVPVRCIQVDSPSNQYLASAAFVPTHNSVLESSMLTQLLHNNDPTDLELRCVEPKNELQAIQSFEHVTRFVDFNTLTPGQSFYAGTADMLDDTVTEMERRYQLMTNHPEQPRKLSEARLIATRETPPPGMDRHPFDLPYIVVVIEECGDIFRAPTLRNEKQDHERVLYAAELLARKARAAGIYLIMVTQYPTNQNIPSTIKQQTRRIGLAVNTQIASMVIIDEPGLEAIQVKGRGLMSYGKGYRGFRALYLRRPSEEEPDLPDDFTSFTAHIPRHGGLITVGGTQNGTLRRPPQPPPGIW